MLSNTKRTTIKKGAHKAVFNTEKLHQIIDESLIAPGRTDEVRLRNEKELKATELLAIPLTEAYVKIGKHGVNDDKADMDIPVWLAYYLIEPL